MSVRRLPKLKDRKQKTSKKMKLQLDTNTKTIRIEESVNLGELTEMLAKILPKDWKDYKIETTVIQNYAAPIIIERHRPYRTLPWWECQPTVTYLSTQSTTRKNPYDIQAGAQNQKHGIYNLQIN